MPADVITVEFYSAQEPDKLLAAADLPRKRAEEAAQMVGRALCKAIGTDSLNAILIGADGNVVERLLVCRR